MIVTDPDAQFRFNIPITLKQIVPFDPTAAAEELQKLRSGGLKTPPDWRKRADDREAAKAGNARPACEDDGEDDDEDDGGDNVKTPSVRRDSAVVGQAELEELIYRRIELENLEERIAVALSKGARVERGVHTAELVPTRDDGHVYLKLVVR
jgi:hypothetical protein